MRRRGKAPDPGRTFEPGSTVRVTSVNELRAAQAAGGEVIDCNLWHGKHPWRFHWAKVRIPPTHEEQHGL